MKAKIIAKIIFLFMLIVQTLYICIGPDFLSILLLKFTLFEIGVIAAIAYMIIRLLLNPKKENVTNKIFLFLILGLFLYQAIVTAPLLYLEGYTFKEVTYAVFRRSYLLVIPFLYFYVFPAFKNNESPIFLINISGLILVIFFVFNHLAGFVDYTSTGEVRIAPGISTIVFALILINNFSFLSHKKTNYIFIATALIGLVFANHKSAYLGILVISLIALINVPQLKTKAKTALQIALLLVLILIPLSQIPFVANNFWGRVSSSFTTDDPNADSRFNQYQMAWDYFKDNPINGSMVNNIYYSDKSKNIVPPHSFLFQILASQGIVGVVAHFFILTFILSIGYKNRRDPYSFQMFLVIVFYIVFTLLNENFYSPGNILILNFSSALILYRNKCIENAKDLFNVMSNVHKEESESPKNEELIPSY